MLSIPLNKLPYHLLAIPQTLKKNRLKKKPQPLAVLLINLSRFKEDVKVAHLIKKRSKHKIILSRVLYYVEVLLNLYVPEMYEKNYNLNIMSLFETTSIRNTHL